MSVKLRPSRQCFFSTLWHRHTCCSPGTVYTCFDAAVVAGAHLYRNCPRRRRCPLIPAFGEHAHTFRHDMPKFRHTSPPPHPLPYFSVPSHSRFPLALCRPLALYIYLYPSSNSELNLSSNNNNEPGECHVSTLLVWVPL